MKCTSLLLTLLTLTAASVASTASAAPSIVGTWKAVQQKCEDTSALKENYVSAVAAQTEIQFAANGTMAVKSTVEGQVTAVTGRYVATDTMVTTYGFKPAPAASDADESTDTLSTYSFEKGHLVVITTMTNDNDGCPMGDRMIVTFARKK